MFGGELFEEGGCEELFALKRESSAFSASALHFCSIEGPMVPVISHLRRSASALLLPGRPSSSLLKALSLSENGLQTRSMTNKLNSALDTGPITGLRASADDLFKWQSLFLTVKIRGRR